MFCSQYLHAESKINPKEINPLILEQLTVWISDTTDFDDFVAIQLDEQFDRNRFFIGGDRIYCGANEEKKNWKLDATTDEWKIKNLENLKKRLSGWQLESFNESYEYKINNGMSLFKKNLTKD